MLQSELYNQLFSEIFMKSIPSKQVPRQLIETAATLTRKITQIFFWLSGYQTSYISLRKSLCSSGGRCQKILLNLAQYYMIPILVVNA